MSKKPRFVGTKGHMQLSPDVVDELLGNWVKLNKELLDLPLAAVVQLLAAELKGDRRQGVLDRLHGRYNKLRANEERIGLKDGIAPWNLKLAGVHY